MARYKLDLIGPFGLFTPGGERIEITSKKAIALVALIVSSPGGVRARRWLETMLWGNRGTVQAQASLRRELTNLAKQLDSRGAGHLLVRGMQRVGLLVDELEVDVFSHAIAFAQQSGRPSEFLEGLDLKDCEEFEDWLRDERERLRAMREADIPVAAPLSAPAEVLGMPLPDASELLANSPPRLPPKPSVAVLPFEQLNAGGGWLGAAIADEVGVLLSSFPQLFIVASASARALVAQGLVRHEIASRLGVRYLLDGTVASQGGRLRVSVALIEGKGGEQIWAQTFAGAAADCFELQKEIAAHVAPQIWTGVDTAERRRSLQRAQPATDNYAIYWRANALYRSWLEEDVLEAVALASALAADDPTCPWAASLAAYCHSLAWLLHYGKNREVTRRSAILHYQNAVRYGESNVEALGYAAGTLLNLGGDLDVADRLIGHALRMLPAHQPTLFWGGWVDVLRGVPDRARERFELALRINPATGARVQTLCGIGFSCLLQERPGEAARFFAEAQSEGGFILAELGAAITGGPSRGETTSPIFAAPVIAEILGMFREPRHRAMLASAFAARSCDDRNAFGQTLTCDTVPGALHRRSAGPTDPPVRIRL